MRTLWIFGDSFSRSSTEPRTWPQLLSQRLGTELVNVSLRGASPDWIIRQYLTALAQIDPEDPVIVLFTNPNRFWFYEDQPDLTNPAITDFAQHRNSDQARAAQSYFQYLQRPELDLQWTYYRAMAVSHETQRLNLRRPLLIQAFAQDVSAAEHFHTVAWAQGTLTDLQFREYRDRDSVMASIQRQGVDPVFRGTDCRYNHLCLLNHSVLADKLAQHFLSDQPVDLTQGFHEKILDEQWHTDTQWRQDQLDPEQIEIYLRQNQSKNPFKKW